MKSTGHIGLLTLVLAASGASAQDGIHVRHEVVGCYTDNRQAYDWRPVEGGYAHDERFLSDAELEQIRRRILACRSDPADLPAHVGVTRASYGAHRAELLEIAIREPQRWRHGAGGELDARVVALLSWERVRDRLEQELRGKPTWMLSLGAEQVRVVLPGDPKIVVETSASTLLPWMLPWTIVAGDERWQVAHTAVPRALHRLVDPEGPLASRLDGSAYWTDEVWRDASSWWGYADFHASLALQGPRGFGVPILATWVGASGVEEWGALTMRTWLLLVATLGVVLASVLGAGAALKPSRRPGWVQRALRAFGWPALCTFPLVWISTSGGAIADALVSRFDALGFAVSTAWVVAFATLLFFRWRGPEPPWRNRTALLVAVVLVASALVGLPTTLEAVTWG